jgi:hypothetical protein
VWRTIAVEWDDRHEVHARFWGLEPEAAAAALATLREDESGRWIVEGPPDGLRALASANGDRGAGWYEDDLRFRRPDPGLGPYLRITRSTATPSDAALLAVVLAMPTEPSDIERATVRGQPAIIVASREGTPGSYHRALWFEPDHHVLVDLAFFGADRTDLDRAIASVRAIGDPAWDDMLTRCTGVEHHGTIRTNPDWIRGGVCPGGDEDGG